MNSQHSRLLRRSLLFVAIAAVGAFISLGGWFFFGSMTMAKVGFSIALIGVVGGFATVAIGLVTFGPEAVRGSMRSARDLEEKVVSTIETKK